MARRFRIAQHLDALADAHNSPMTDTAHYQVTVEQHDPFGDKIADVVSEGYARSTDRTLQLSCRRPAPQQERG